VTVPLTILQDGDIEFCPPLPAEKTGAISRVGMSTAVKVLLVFKSRFWPETFWDACCPFGFLPEIWATEYPTQETIYLQSEPEGKAVIVGFVAGDRAKAIGKLSEGEIVSRSLEQLDSMFGSNLEPKPASSSLCTCLVKNWSDEPFIRGAYSYPTFGAKANDRAILGEPVGRSLFFAGEATHEGVNSCMQGALETAERAVRQLLSKRTENRSKL